jgi:hypothetical protein
MQAFFPPADDNSAVPSDLGDLHEQEDIDAKAFDMFAALKENGGLPVHGEAGAPSVAETLLWIFDYMALHKTTLAEMKFVHKMLQLVLPPQGRDDIRYEVAKAIVAAHLDNTLIRIDICPNDCIAYWDPTSPLLAKHRHGHREKCPREGCKMRRKYTDAKGTIRARKVKLYFHLHVLTRINTYTFYF